MEAIQFTEAERIWSETTLELGTIAKSLMGNQEEVTAGNFIGTQLVENPNFDQNIPGDSSPVLGNELVQNGSFEEIGAELVTNGDFITDLSGWTLDTTRGSYVWDAERIKITNNGAGSYPNCSQDITTIIGKTYRFRGRVEIGTATTIEFRATRTGGNATQQLSTNGTIDFTFVADQTSTKLLCYLWSPTGNTDNYCFFDNISVQQLDPNDYWTLQTGWSLGDDRATYDGSNYTSITQTIPDLIGKTFKLEFEIKDWVSGTIRVPTGKKESGLDIRYSGIGTSYSFGAPAAISSSDDSTFNGSITNISVKEIIAVDNNSKCIHFMKSVKFTEGKATIDYDSDGTPQGECGIRQSILSVGKLYNVEVDFKLITGTARLYCGSNFVTLTGTAKRTYSLKCEGTSKLSIVRSSNTSDTKIELYSVNAYESTNLVVNGTGSDSVGLSGDWGLNNSTIESDLVSGGITLTGTGTQGYMSQILSTTIGVEYRLYAKADFGTASKFFVWNDVNNFPTPTTTDGVSFIDFTATGTTTTIRVYIQGTAGQFINVTDINCSPTTPFDLGSNWDLQAGTGLVANGYGNNNAVESFTAVAGQTYRIEYKVSSYTQGSVRVQIGGTNGTANASVGTFVENLIATNTGDIDIQNVQVGGLNFIGVIDYIKIQSGEQSDTLDMTDQDPKAIWITGGGNLKVTDMSGTTSTINNLPNDKFIDWLRIRKIWLTGTTATGIKGIY